MRSTTRKVYLITMPERTLSQRELNRATLARQLLLERSTVAPRAVLEHLVAMQGQVSNAPYIGLWTRLQDFQRADLATLIEQREVVRASSLRCTLHLLTADDYLSIHRSPKLTQVWTRQTWC